jgi:hypothetical protein
MKSMNTKLVLSALGLALLATPAFAQKPHHRIANPETMQTQNDPVGVYPNPVGRSGSEESVQSGSAIGLDRGY